MTKSNTRGLEDDPTDSSSTDTPSNAADTDQEQVHASDLTLFQVNILTILAEKERYGLAIKRALEEYCGEEVNHGRLYPNLDDLVDLDLVEKSELDKRTNQYALTDAGRELVAGRIQWLTNRAAWVDVDAHQQAPKDRNGDPIGIGGGD